MVPRPIGFDGFGINVSWPNILLSEPPALALGAFSGRFAEFFLAVPLSRNRSEGIASGGVILRGKRGFRIRQCLARWV